MKVLDACCGSRMMWFNKDNSEALFMDTREETHILCDGRTLNITPDIQADFRNMPFPDNSFYLVVFDPPHARRLGNNSWMAKKYGVLTSTWEDDIKQGFNECMRVLKPNGTLVFKWSEVDISVKEIISIVGQSPLFGHTTKRHGQTIWMTFMKDEASKRNNETQLTLSDYARNNRKQDSKSCVEQMMYNKTMDNSVTQKELAKRIVKAFDRENGPYDKLYEGQILKAIYYFEKGYTLFFDEQGNITDKVAGRGF